MGMLVSRITAKGQTVIPKAICDKLKLKPGDFVRYVMEGTCVTIERAKIEAEHDPFATFGEWSSEADEDAYSSL
jgi:antitoxin PrlF